MISYVRSLEEKVRHFEAKAPVSRKGMAEERGASGSGLPCFETPSYQSRSAHLPLSPELSEKSLDLNNAGSLALLEFGSLHKTSGADCFQGPRPYSP